MNKKSENRRERSNFEAEWQRRFQEFADNDDDAAIAGWSESGLQARLRNFARLWENAQPGEQWLDAGCGAGTYTRFMASQGAKVTGLDYSLPTLMKARGKQPSAAGWCVGDVTHLPVAPASVDGALCFGVMQALANSEPAVRELHTAVKAGGEVWIDALNVWCPPNFYDAFRRRIAGRPLHVRYESPTEFKALMQSAGFTDVRLHWVPILPARWQRLQWLLETGWARFMFRFVPPLGALLSHAFVMSGKKSLTDSKELPS